MKELNLYEIFFFVNYNSKRINLQHNTPTLSTTNIQVLANANI